MTVPTYQQLQSEGLDLTNLQWLALKSAAGYAVSVPRSGGKRSVWKQLQDLGLLDTSCQLTLLGKIRLSEELNKKKNKVIKKE